MKISVRSPTRIDLAGGTLDCWPLYLLMGDCHTINLSISIGTTAELNPRSDSKVVLFAKDLNVQKEYADLHAALADSEPAFALVRAHLAYWKPRQGFSLETFSESPVGGGLGGSSSLCVSLLKAFSLWQGEQLELGELVTLAANLEGQLLRKPPGTQDYFPAAQPGLNVIHYGPRGPQAELVTFDADVFVQRMLLVYTGRAHHSGINNWQVLKAAIDGDRMTLESLSELRQIAEEMRQTLAAAQWTQLPELFQRETVARLKLSEGFSSPEILALEELTKKEGAEAIKICGAGGGGCVIVWCPPGKKAKIAEACAAKGYQPLTALPVQ